MGRWPWPGPLPWGPSPGTAQSLPAPDDGIGSPQVPLSLLAGARVTAAVPQAQAPCARVTLSCGGFAGARSCPSLAAQAVPLAHCRHSWGAPESPSPTATPSPEAVSLNIKSSSCWQHWGVGKDSRSNLQLKCVYLRKEVPETCN